MAKLPVVDLPTLMRAAQARADAHDMDEVTQYCRHCGASLCDIIERNFICTSADNIVGISHIVRGRRLDALVGLSLQTPGSHKFTEFPT